MLKKIQFTFLLLVTFVQYNFAYNNLTVGDPRSGWWTYQGNIDEATLTIKPKGIYMEMGLYLTFSAHNTGFGQNDTLEVVLNFTLPQNAIIYDSWLWVGEDIIRAKVIDKWTASEIYEEIVDRRQDPSILFKESDTEYQLRIFPMAGTDTRKVKISYLVPTQWTEQAVSALLPTHILNSSRNVPDLKIITTAKDIGHNPRIAELTDVNFSFQNNGELGNQYETTISKDYLSSPTMTLEIDSPLKNGVYLSRFEGNDANIYQLAYLPSNLSNEPKPQKIAFLLDYQDLESTTSKQDIINITKSFIINNLRPFDQFNLFFSHTTIRQASSEWLYADAETVNQTFDNLENPLASYSNLPSLLAKGIEFIKNKEYEGSLFLISNSDHVGTETIANQLIDDLTFLMTEKNIPINILDFQNKSLPSHYIGGLYYKGNEYFYSNLSKATGGNYVNVRSNSNQSVTVYEKMVSLLQYFTSGINSLDFHTSLENGFCHSRFTFGITGQPLLAHQPILQIGKFEGSFPFEIEIGGIVDSEIFSQSLSIAEEDVFEADSLSQEIWMGNYLRELEHQGTDNNIIQEIISTSIDERVLSLYTAMICLEPSMGGESCLGCLTEEEIIYGLSDKELLDSLFTIESYPNPFHDKTKIIVELGEKTDIKELQFGVYNYLGQLVRTFEPSYLATDRKLEFEWDATDQNGEDLAKGVYFFMIQTPTKTRSLKLFYY